MEELFPFQTELAIVSDALKGIEAAFEGKARELTNNGIMVFLSKVVKPKPQLLLEEVFRDMEYLISLEGDGNTDSHSDPDDQDGQEDKRILTGKVFDKLLNTMANYLSRPLAKRIWGYAGRISELGAIRLESGVGGAVDVVVKGGLYGIRGALTRCLKICLAANIMEEDEVGLRVAVELSCEHRSVNTLPSSL